MYMEMSKNTKGNWKLENNKVYNYNVRQIGKYDTEEKMYNTNFNMWDIPAYPH